MVKWRPGAAERPDPRADGRLEGGSNAAIRAVGAGMELEVLVAAVSSLMVMVPLWRITRRTGRDPWLSLLFLGTPPIGTLVFMAILAFGRWPAEGPSTEHEDDAFPGAGPDRG
jgi:hypothetical protein